MAELLLFVPSDYDDYGWFPEEFRVLARIHRRCLGKDGSIGTFYESIKNIAKATGISETLVRRSLNVLEEAGAISREYRTGATAIIRFEYPSKWVLPTLLPEIRERYTPSKNVRGKPVENFEPVVTETTPPGIENDRGVVTETTPPVVTESTGGVVTKTIDKGIPLEGIPLEGIPLKEIPIGSGVETPPPPSLIKKKCKAVKEFEKFFDVKIKSDDKGLAFFTKVANADPDPDEWYECMIDWKDYKALDYRFREQISNSFFEHFQEWKARKVDKYDTPTA